MGKKRNKVLPLSPWNFGIDGIMEELLGSNPTGMLIQGNANEVSDKSDLETFPASKQNLGESCTVKVDDDFRASNGLLSLN